MIAALNAAPAIPPRRILVALSELSGLPSEANREQLRRVQSTAGRWLAREAAAQLTGYPPGGFAIGGGGDTPPRLAQSPPAAPSLVIGITHSGSWAGAVATDLMAIGVDIQHVVPRPAARLAEFMGWTTHLAPAGCGAPADADAFTQMWTLWEASVKCDGASLLASSTPAFDALSPLYVPATEWSAAAGGYWAASSRVAPGYWLSVVACCTTPVAPALTIQRLPFAAAVPDED